MTDVYCFAFVEDAPSAAVADKLVTARNARPGHRLLFREGFPAVMRGYGTIKSKCDTFLKMARTGSHTFMKSYVNLWKPHGSRNVQQKIHPAWTVP